MKTKLTTENRRTISGYPPDHVYWAGRPEDHDGSPKSSPPPNNLPGGTGSEKSNSE